MLNLFTGRNRVAIIFCLLSYCASGQSDYRIITGTVTDRYGNPLSGVSVRERDRMYNLGSISDGNGNFRITMYYGYSGLIFSHVDYMMVDIDKPYDGMKVVMKYHSAPFSGSKGNKYRNYKPELVSYTSMGLSKIISDTPMTNFLSAQTSTEIKKQINENLYFRVGIGYLYYSSDLLHGYESYEFSALTFPLTVGLKTPRPVYPVAELSVIPAINLGIGIDKMKFTGMPLLFEGKLGIGIDMEEIMCLHFLIGYGITGEMISSNPMTYRGRDYLEGYFRNIFLLMGLSIPLGY